MIRSTRAQKAERLSAARRLLATEMGMAEAAMALSRTFGLSRRQAYRYLALAGSGEPAQPAESSVTLTVKAPESLADDLRAHARRRGVATSQVIREAMAAYLAIHRHG
jgi:hypothetical protein